MRARRWWGQPLVPVYAAAVGARDWLRRKGWVRVRRLQWPVISVGSLSAGGAGKTPVVIALAELLHRQGWSVDVLSRGYGRTGVGVERVDLAVADAARRFGDEPVVIAQRCAAAVWVAADRYEAGEAAERAAACAGGQQQKKKQQQQQMQQQQRNAGILRFAQNDNLNSDDDSSGLRIGAAESVPGAADAVRRVHLLDDGFQHWGLARAVDVVLVTEEDLNDALLPAGNRREPLEALGRADVVVLREDQRERVEARIRPLLREGAEVWSVQRELRFPDSLGGLEARVRPLAFCAIARPQSFYAMLGAAGFDLAATVDFRDHHAYTLADMERITTMAKESGATGFVVTEKDAVKLASPVSGVATSGVSFGPASNAATGLASGLTSGAGFHFASGSLIERLEAVGPVCVVGLETRFVDEADVMRGLEARLR